MRYFSELGYRVSGLEYVDDLAPQTEALLAEVDVTSKVFHGDFQAWAPQNCWDLVASFGLIEHFEDTSDVLLHHARFCREGGHVLITFPLHCGIYGRVMKWASPERLAQHNRMSLSDAIRGLEQIEGVERVAATHLGRFGFGATRLHNKLDDWFPGSKLSLGVPLRIVERAGRRLLPNTKAFSPFAGLLFRVVDLNAVLRAIDARTTDFQPI